MLSNPVLMKEMRSRMRGGRAFVVLLLYDGLLCLAFVMFLVSNRLRWVGADWAAVAPRLGRDFFIWLILLQALLVVFIAPALTSGAITIEREQRTFELLYLTLVSRRAIFIGKLISALCYLILLVVSSVPLAGFCFLLGGVAPSEVAAAYGVIISSALFFGTMGLCSSTVSARTNTATLIAFGAAILLVVGTALIMIVAGRSGSWSVFRLALAANPIFSVVSVVDSFLFVPGISILWLPTIAAYTAISLLEIWLVPRSLSPHGIPRRRSSAAAPRTAALPSANVAITTAYAWDEVSRLLSRIENPVLRREVLARLRSQRTMTPKTARMCLLSTGVIVGLLMMCLTLWVKHHDDWRALFGVFAHLQLLLACVLAPVTCANLFTREREQQSLELLMLTRMTPAEICAGKLVSRMLSLAMLAVALLPVMLLAALRSGMSCAQTAGAYSLLVGCALSFGAVGLYCSAQAHRTQVATSVAVGLLAMLLLGLPISIFICTFRTGELTLTEYIVATNPFGAMEGLVDPHLYANQPAWLGPGSYWLHAVFWYGGLGAVLFTLLCRKLERLCTT